MKVSELIDKLGEALSPKGFGLEENYGGCAIAALYFAKHLVRLKIPHKIIYWSDGHPENDCAHCQVRLATPGGSIYLDSEGVGKRRGYGNCTEVVKTKKFVAWAIENVDWNNEFCREDIPLLYSEIDAVFDDVGA